MLGMPILVVPLRKLLTTRHSHGIKANTIFGRNKALKKHLEVEITGTIVNGKELGNILNDYFVDMNNPPSRMLTHVIRKNHANIQYS